MLVIFLTIVSASGCGRNELASNDAPRLENGSELWVAPDVEPIIPANQLSSVETAARQGDNAAAHRLAYHYQALHRDREYVLWLEVAAGRGDCAAMALLRGLSQDAGSQHASSYWNDLMRARRCTWEKAYGRLEGESARINNMPLWEE